MKTIAVHKPFRLVHGAESSKPAGTPEDFGVGTHEVANVVADHWYVQEHSKVVAESPDPEPAQEAAEDEKKGKRQK